MNVDFVQILGVYSCAWNWKLGAKKMAVQSHL